MKRLAKWLALIFASIVCFCCFCGCEKTGPIPDGRYEYIDSLKDETRTEYIYMGDKAEKDYFWQIEGDEAWFFASNYLRFRGKIVEKDGKIYFEGYKWLDVFSLLFGRWEMEGFTDVYLIEYNAEEKIFTEELYKRGD